MRNLVEALERVIPHSWAAPGEPVGLQAGDTDKVVSRVWPAVWVSKEVLRRAGRRKADFLITYYPLWKSEMPPPAVRSVEFELMRLLCRQDISVYSVGSSIDFHPLGPSRELGERLDLARLQPALPKPQARHAKLVTFVPPEHTDAVRSAMASAGAGRIGEYEVCSFRVSGEGSFRGSPLTRPFIGQPGRLEFAQEDRLEMICPVEALTQVVAALRNSHPYEEPAYDVYMLQDLRDPRQSLWLGVLKEPHSLDRLAARVTRTFPSVSPPEVICSRRSAKIRRVACTAADGSPMVAHVTRSGQEALICRGISDRAAWELTERGIACFSLGRSVLEDLFPSSVRRILQPWAETIPLV